MEVESASLWALFASAFISSTLLPGGSEVLLAYLGARGVHASGTLLAVAAAGNSLGGMTSWGIGRLLPARRAASPRLEAARERVRRHGAVILLLSWVPVIGDPLCLAAGWLRVSWVWSLLFIAFGKTARYAVVLAVV